MCVFCLITIQTDEPFLYSLVPVVIDSFGGAYPHLAERAAVIQSVLKSEETIFHTTLHAGEKVLQHTFNRMAKQPQSKVVSGETAFQLYDTFSFPLDLTELISRERGYSVDVAGFETAMQSQRERARKARKADGSGTNSVDLQELRHWQSLGIQYAAISRAYLLAASGL